MDRSKVWGILIGLRPFRKKQSSIKTSRWNFSAVAALEPGKIGNVEVVLGKRKGLFTLS